MNRKYHLHTILFLKKKKELSIREFKIRKGAGKERSDGLVEDSVGRGTIKKKKANIFRVSNAAAPPLSIYLSIYLSSIPFHSHLYLPCRTCACGAPFYEVSSFSPGGELRKWKKEKKNDTVQSSHQLKYLDQRKRQSACKREKKRAKCTLTVSFPFSSPPLPRRPIT